MNVFPGFHDHLFYLDIKNKKWFNLTIKIVILFFIKLSIMKHVKIILCLFFLTIISCKTEIKKENLVELNGFWEITKVEMPDGSSKEFKINETIDFIKFDEMNGFRNKVIPQLDGKLLSNNLTEKFTIVEKENAFWFQYKTEHASWVEELIALNNEEMVVKNSNELIYFYKKRTDLKKE